MKKWLVFFLFTVPLWSKSQSFSNIESVKKVFNYLVQAYANGKGAPDLMIVPLNEIQVKAEYYTTKDGNPVIKIDQQLINICFSLGKDSINALAFILSHELSHYYRDDNWCMDYAKFKYKTNPAIAKKMKEASERSKEKEAIADKEGLLHSGIAGFSSFRVFDKLINVIYAKYKLKDNLPGYPTKSERKEINRDASLQAQKWLRTFNAGVSFLNAGKYQKAIDTFKLLSKKFPSREVFNNLGVAKARKALLLKPKSYEEVQFPDRFLYPLEVENKSRLSIDDTRSLDDEKAEEFNNLLKEAQKNFQEAIRIDPSFTKSYVNLACVYDLMDNWEGAIGKIKELSIEQQNTIDAKRILAIAYYHNNQRDLSTKIWNELNTR